MPAILPAPRRPVTTGPGPAAPGTAYPCRMTSSSDRSTAVDVKGTYEVRTYGCQMNVHDSERLSGLLEGAGYTRAPEGSDGDADVVVFNTCAVRENADNKLYGNLGRLAPMKTKRPGMQIAVGGCLAQKDRDTIVKRAPWVDVVFGTHNIGKLPVLLERARVQEEAQVEIAESLEAFPPRSRPAASPPTPPGSRSPSAATTRAPSASSRRCAARRRTAVPATSSPRWRPWSPRASPRSPCSART
ncbi:hypothetical protein GCM10020254_25810 [Streptomyces goshikiensis]